MEGKMEEMELTYSNHESIIRLFIKEWTRRSESDMLKSYGPGCFVWNAKKDGIKGTGMFYTLDMVPKYLQEDMASDLLEMIQDADHERQLVVALIFENKIVGYRLSKLK
jgi:hypothetical protein